MSVYAVRVWNNSDDMDRGSMGEFDMTNDPSEVSSEIGLSDTKGVEMRLLEAINCNLAAIAESLDKLCYPHNR